MTENILTQPASKEIVLSDGKAYTIPSFSMNTLVTLEDTLDCDTAQMGDKFRARSITAIRAVIYSLLHENYPELTLEDVGRLVPLDRMQEVTAIVEEALKRIVG